MLRRWLASVCEQDQPPSVTALALLAREAANMLAGTAQHFPFLQSIVEREWNFTPEVHAAAKSSMWVLGQLGWHGLACNCGVVGGYMQCRQGMAAWPGEGRTWAGPGMCSGMLCPLAGLYLLDAACLAAPSPAHWVRHCPPRILSAPPSRDTVTDLLELLCAYEAAGVAPHPALALAVSDAVAARDIIDHDVYADSLTLLDKALASAVGVSLGPGAWAGLQASSSGAPQRPYPATCSDRPHPCNLSTLTSRCPFSPLAMPHRR